MMSKKEVTLQKLKRTDGKPVYKVTVRIPELEVAETEFFKSKKKAKRKFRELSE